MKDPPVTSARYRTECSVPDTSQSLSSQSASALFVDDDADVLTSARILLGRHGWRLLTAQSPAEAWSILAAERVDVVLLDLNFSRGATSGDEGFHWLSEIRAHDPLATVIVVTGHSGVNIAVQAMKAGASDFIMKPWNNGRFLETMNDALALARSRRDEAAAMTPGASDEPLFLGDSAAARGVRDRIGRVAPTDAAITLLGPAGAGKSLVARLIHLRSRRAEGPFVTIDIQSAAPGDWDLGFDRAAGGTLVLDEIADLDRSGQADLLRRLETQADIRVVSTTRRGAEGLGQLRDDLLARLNTIEIVLSPLSERGQDSLLILEHYVRLFSHRAGRPPKSLDDSARELLGTGRLRGEVRGLRQAAERAVALSEGALLTAADLMPQTPLTATLSPVSELSLARSEKLMIETALRRHAHNVSTTARALGLSRAALYRRMLKHGL